MPSRLVLVVVLGTLSLAASAQSWQDEGIAALRSGDDEAALSRFVVAAEADPGDDEVRALHDLTDLRRRLGEAGALSVSDTRRLRLARRLMALDPASALGHVELALRAFLDYEWRRRNAERRGAWQPLAPNRTTRAAFAARTLAHAHLDTLTETEPGWASAHRLRMRIAAFDDDPRALGAAADAARRARPDDPWSALYYALALARLGRIEEAEARCRLGVERLPLAERAVFTEAARFVRSDDRAQYDADATAWTERFWQTRDSRLLTPVNERWVEHCARLVEADLLYGADSVRGWDTARGDTHVRYGRPVRDVWWLAQGDGRYHRWVYADFAVTFHDWTSSGDYHPASRADGEDDATRLRSFNNSVGERGAWDITLPVAVSVSAFRSTGGGTEWVVAYGAEDGGSRGIDTGVFLLDADGRIADEERQGEDRLAPHPEAGWTGVATVPASGARLVVEALRGSSFGRAEADVPCRAFAGGGVALSDLLLAYRLDLADGPTPPGHVRRGALVLHPAPDASFSTAEPLVLYAEAYGLRLGNGGTRFEVKAVLQPVDEAGRLRRLARRIVGRRPPPAVAVASTETGDAPDDVVALTLDLRRQPPGPYRLTLTVRDLVAGTAASASRSVRLDSP